jgi:hypothetical protein
MLLRYKLIPSVALGEQQRREIALVYPRGG